MLKTDQYSTLKQRWNTNIFSTSDIQRWINVETTSRRNFNQASTLNRRRVPTGIINNIQNIAIFVSYFLGRNDTHWQQIDYSPYKLLWIYLQKQALTIRRVMVNSIFLFYSILSHNLGRSSGHHRWIRNNPFPSWPVFSCPSWAGKVHSCPLFDIVFPPLLLSASFSFSFHCAL